MAQSSGGKHAVEHRQRLSFPLRFKFKFVKLMGLAATKASEDMLRYSEVDAVAVGDYLEERGVTFWYDNFPLRRLGRHAAHSLELATLASDQRYFDYDHKGGSDYADAGYQLSGQCWPTPCDSCTLRPICCGVGNGYWTHQGAGELRPSSDDPLPILVCALDDLGKGPFAVRHDPAMAPVRLEALRKEPRPRHSMNQGEPSTLPANEGTTPPVDENSVRLRGVQKDLVVELGLELTQPDRPAYVKVGPFSLSYIGKGDAVREQPGVQQLLDAAEQTLKQCDPAATVQAAGAAITKAVEPLGWKPTAAGTTVEVPLHLGDRNTNRAC